MPLKDNDLCGLVHIYDCFQLVTFSFNLQQRVDVSHACDVSVDCEWSFAGESGKKVGKEIAVGEKETSGHLLQFAESMV